MTLRFARSGAVSVLLLVSSLVASSVKAAAGDVLLEQKLSDVDGYLSDPVTPGNPGGLLADLDRFGFGVAGLGDLDGDGVDDVAISAEGDSETGTLHGSVYVLLLNADGTVKSRVKISDGEGGLSGSNDPGHELGLQEQFGASMAALGDLNRDGIPDLVVGSAGGTASARILMLDAAGTVKSTMRLADGFGGIPHLTLPSEGVYYAGLAGPGDIDGDGIPDLLLGSYTADDGAGANLGAVHVLFLRRNGSVRALQTISDTQGQLSGLGNPGGLLQEGDFFGLSVAALGDLDGDGVTEIAVGAVGHDGPGPSAPDWGAVWILFLNRDGTVKPAQNVRITADNAAGFAGPLTPGNGFGRALATLGDLDGDGVVDLAVGAHQDDDGTGLPHGAVWILYLTGTGTVKAASRIANSSPTFTGPILYGDSFALALAPLGDLNGDGVMDLVAGAPNTDANGTFRGAAWNLMLDGSPAVCGDGVLDPILEACDDGNTLSGDGCEASCVLPDPAPALLGLTDIGATSITHDDLSEVGIDGDFGHAAVTGDFNGDGLADLAVGDPFDQTTVNNGGAVHVVYGTDGGPDPANDLTLRQGLGGVAGVNEADDSFGFALAVGDFDGDGYDDLAVGAPYEDVGAASWAGSVVVIHGAMTVGLLPGQSVEWTQDSPGVLGVAETNDRFGYALAAGDFDGDGYDDLAIGVPGQDLGGNDGAGMVNVLRGSASGLTDVGDATLGQDFAWVADVDEPGDAFGKALAAGDFNGDGLDDLAVGVPGEEVSGDVEAGAVNVFHGDAATLFDSSQALWWTADGTIGPAGAAFDHWGAALASCDLDRNGYFDLMIGVPGRANGGLTDAGNVFVAPGGSSGLNPFVTSLLWGGDARAGSLLGGALVCGDFDGDGYADVAAGARYDDLRGNNAGRVEVLYTGGATPAGSGGTWQTWFRDDLRQTPSPDDQWGASLAAGDFDGNGLADLAVGMVPAAADGAVDVIPGLARYDSDGDGISDWDEIHVYGTDPYSAPLVSWPAVLNSDAATDGYGPESPVPELATDGQGTWVAVWGRPGDGEVLSRSVDDGATWSPPAIVISVESLADTYGFDVALDAAGNCLVSAIVDIGGNPYPLRILVKSSTDGCATLSPSQWVSWGDLVYVTALASDGNGSWMLVWDHLVLPPSGLPDLDIVFSRQLSGESTFGPEAWVNSDAATDSGQDSAPDVATDGAGTWVVVWLGDLVVHFARSTDFGDHWSPSAVLSAATAPGRPRIAYAGSGHWVVVWESQDDLGGTIGSDGDILASTSADGGVSWSPAVAVNSGAATDGDLEGDPRIACDGLRCKVVWESNAPVSAAGGWNIFSAVSIDRGSTWSDAELVNHNVEKGAFDDAPNVATDGSGRWITAWLSNDDTVGMGTYIGSDTDILYATGLGNDSDGDGLLDYFETLHGLDPNTPGEQSLDLDGDGLDNLAEQSAATNPLDDDTDDDGILDGDEVGLPPNGPLGSPAYASGAAGGPTDPRNADTDGDGLLDGTEIGLTAPQGSDTDLAVFVADLDPASTTDPALADSDGDGLDDGQEDLDRNGRVDPGETDPNDSDSDGDGYSDGEEVLAGSDPLDPDSTPAVVPTLPFAGLVLLCGALAVTGVYSRRDRGRRDRGLGVAASIAGLVPIAVAASPAPVEAQPLPTGQYVAVWGIQLASPPAITHDGYAAFEVGTELAAGDFDGDGLADLAMGDPYGNATPAGGSELTSSGAVFVLYGTTTTPNGSASQYIDQDVGGIQGAAEAEDHFGAVLAVGNFNGDAYDDLAIGIPGEDLGSIVDCGAVHVLYGSSGGLTANGDQVWTQDSTGVVGIADPGDAFGSALAVGDFDWDGFDDLAVGIPGKDIPGFADAGTVQILRGSSSGLTDAGNQKWEQDYSTVEGEVVRDGERFGAALAAGHFNVDGYADLAIGVPGDQPTASPAGAVNVLYGGVSGLSDSGDQLWHLDTPGVIGTGAADDWYGASLAAGDFDGDGGDDLAVGIPYKDFSPNPPAIVYNAGAVSVLYGGSASGLTTAYNQFLSVDLPWIFGVGVEGAFFGQELAAGDLDGNGIADLAVGEPETSVPTVNGRIEVFYGSLLGFSEQAGAQDIWGPLPPQLFYDLGASLATGDFDGDGRSELFAGGRPAGGRDGEVLFYGLAILRDSDSDGLSDADEVIYGTDPFDDDTDDDGILDGNEVVGGTLAAGARGAAANGGTDPLLADTDGDGLLDGTEIGLTAPQGSDTDLAVFVADQEPASTTDPSAADSDGDGLDDGQEDLDRNGRVDPGETDPNDSDSDGDGYPDGQEVLAGSDPLDPDSIPLPPVVPTLPFAGLVLLCGALAGTGVYSRRDRHPASPLRS